MGIGQSHHTTSTSTSTTTNQRTTNLRNISWDLAGLGGAMKEEENSCSAVDYDVVAPWVLRNMVKSAGDQVMGHSEFTTGDWP